MDIPVKLELAGLSDLDRDELEALLAKSGAAPSGYAFSERVPATAGRARDFGATALLISALGPSAIAAIALWLEKKRTRTGSKTTLRVWDANGTKRYESEEICSGSSSAPPPPEIAEKLSQITKVDFEDLLKKVKEIRE